MKDIYIEVRNFLGRKADWRIQEIIREDKIEINSPYFNQTEIQLILKTVIEHQHKIFICGEVSINEVVLVITGKQTLSR